MPKYPKVNYIGNKEKLVDWIISELPVKKGKILDIFSGGCSVSYALKKAGYSVISNDSLYANYVIGKALIENSDEILNTDIFDVKPTEERIKIIRRQIDFLNNRLYFDYEVDELAHLIAISESLNGYKQFIFLSLLRRAMIRKLPYSRMNVPWNQITLLRDEEYSYKKYKRRRAYHNQTFESHMRENIIEYNNSIFKGLDCKVYNCDAFELVNKIDSVDVIYLDPPYPSTMNNYDAFYGLFDKMFGMENSHIDFTKKSNFLNRLESLIKLYLKKTKYIVLSLNSNVNPNPKEILDMLEKYGKVTVKEKAHVYKVTGKENKNVTKELLFILELDNN